MFAPFGEFMCDVMRHSRVSLFSSSVTAVFKGPATLATRAPVLLAVYPPVVGVIANSSAATRSGVFSAQADSALTIRMRTMDRNRIERGWFGLSAFLFKGVAGRHENTHLPGKSSFCQVSSGGRLSQRSSPQKICRGSFRVPNFSGKGLCFAGEP